MKKNAKCLLSFLMAIIIFVTVIFAMNQKVCAVWQDEFNIGDVNCDDNVNVDDAVEILRYYAKKAAGSTEIVNEELYDVNYDGSISVDDAILVLQHYAKVAAGQTDKEWPPSRYHFGQVLTYKSTQSMYMLLDENGTCSKILNGGDVFTILKYVGNNEYMISYDSGIYYIKIENYKSFEWLFDAENFAYTSFYTYPEIGDFAVWYNGFFIIPVETDDSEDTEIITLGDVFVILENMGKDKYKIMKKNGIIGTAIFERDDFCKSMYKLVTEV